MYSYYLQDRAYYYASDLDVVNHIQSLSKILSNADSNDHFLKSADFEKGKYDRWDDIGGFLSSSRVPSAIRTRIWPSIQKRIKVIPMNFMSLISMNQNILHTSNAFLGPKFSSHALGLIINYNQYVHFKTTLTTNNVDGTNFGKSCNILLKNVIVTNDAKNKVKSLGQDIKSIFMKLLELEDYVRSYWTKGAFSIENVKANTKLDISDESDSVKNDPMLNHYRHFRIPEIGGKDCFIHIKKGGWRFHIYPDDGSRKIYVPYIGPHLPTKHNP